MSTDILTAVQNENRILRDKIESMYAVEEMQKIIIEANGRFFTSDELLKMTIAEFIQAFHPNGVRLHVTLEKGGKANEPK